MTYPAAIDSFSTKVDGTNDVMAVDVNGLQTALVNTQTALGTNPQGSATDVKTRFNRMSDAYGNLQLKTADVKTISGGVITIDQNLTAIETQGGASSDDLDTITAPAGEMLCWLRINNAARTVYVKNGTGNIVTVGGVDIHLAATSDLAIGYYDTVLVKWVVMGLGAGALLSGANTFTAYNLFNGGIGVAQRSVSGDTTLGANDGSVWVNASGAARTISLPTAAGIGGQIYVIKKIDSSANTVTIDGFGAETIDGSATKVLSAQWAKAIIQSDNVNWEIIA